MSGFHKLINKALSVRLRLKVMIGYAAVSLFLFSVMAFMGLFFLQVKARYDALNVMSGDIQVITQLKADINGVRAAFLRMAISKDPAVWDNQESVISFYSGKSDENINKLKGGGFSLQAEQIAGAWTPFRETLFKEMIPLVRSGRVNEAMELLGAVQSERSKRFMDTANSVIDSSREEFSRSMADIQTAIKKTSVTIVSVVLIIFSAAFALSFMFVGRFVISVLQGISSSAEKVASGDLTVKVESRTGDEFGKLAADVTKIIRSIQVVMREVANKTVHILKDATSLTLHGKEVSQRVDSDLERTTAAAAAIEQMSSTVADIAMNINSVSKAAGDARDVSARGKEMVDETVSSIGNVNTQITRASGKVRDLAELSHKIDGIVVMIKDIADQTNLLALNAAIEAARAGEQGRGFAVVADEVRKLAHRTAGATSEINDILGSIHTGTVDATDFMEEAVDGAKKADELARRLDSVFAEIHTGFMQVSDMVQHVVTSSDEQYATTTEISMNLTKIADDARESSRTVKDMALSFNKFSNDAKEFLRLLDGFNDPKMRIGVLKSDYVLWLHRLLDFLDLNASGAAPVEMYAEKSRMGKWYFGEGKATLHGSAAFRALESPHRRLHETGLKAYEAAAAGRKDVVRQYINEAVLLVDEIVEILGRLEAEV